MVCVDVHKYTSDLSAVYVVFDGAVIHSVV